MNNTTVNLSSFGFNNYYLTTEGTLYKGIKEVKRDSLNRLHLTDTKGKTKRITLKSLYKQVFEKEFCIDIIENLEGEKWKTIPNTKEKYFVSNYGRIKSYCNYNAIILKPYLQQSGYLEVKIAGKNQKIHQIVAFAFCENKYRATKTKTEIHHKNKIRTDNRAANLEILSVEEHHKKHSKKEKFDNE